MRLISNHGSLDNDVVSKVSVRVARVCEGGQGSVLDIC